MDLDVAWNRYSLEYLFNAYEVAYETAFVEDVSYEYEYFRLCFWLSCCVRVGKKIRNRCAKRCAQWIY